ncbi:ribonuclease III [Candidatus Saganbacteria bacterium]|uniref:Ribonuclease 3 n=1 Tax=Candidatus Saganbacteria bacterium TaxID=2575572 RepID=A0A9D6UM69_UNCSA|nr:ribonuclease III [Candidatus Saganbacteria bacterium]
MEQLTVERERELQDLGKKLGVSFLNKFLLNQSLTHSSYGHEQNCPDNERLEFLGDAVIKLVVSEYLYHKFPAYAEGELTKIRAAAISDETFGKVGKKLNLGEYLLLSPNEKKSGGQKRKSNLANAFEAVVGAVYMDAGLGKVRDLIVELLREEVETVSRAGYIRDYKSALQEHAQKYHRELPHYHVIKETGPRHRRVFWVEVKLKGKRCGVGRGGNKKEAEQRAAAMALRRLKTEEKQEKKESDGLRSLISRVRKRIRLP